MMFCRWAVAFGVTLALPVSVRAAGHPIIIVTPVVSGPAGPVGAPAGLPLEVLDAEPVNMAGRLTPNLVIAQHTVRAGDAVVLTAAVEQGVIDIPAGTVLAKVVLKAGADDADDAGRVLWCRTGPLARLHANQTDCLEDPAHAGAFSRFQRAPLGVLDASFAVADVAFGPGVQIDPAAYRPAKPEERPTTRIGYRWCSGDGDGSKIPFRFTSVIFQEGYGWRGEARACPFGAWSDAGRRRLKVDRIDLDIAGSADGPRYQVAGRIPAGPIAAFRTSGQSILGAEAPPVELTQRADARSAQALLPAGLAEGLTPGLHAHGDEIVQAPVVHGVTGVLKSDVVQTGLSFRQIHAGQYAFGIPMRSSSGEEQITWCVPEASRDNPNRFASVCFPPVGAGHVWVPALQPLMPTGLSWPSTIRPDVVGLDVERKAASLGAPMRLTYVFDRWRALPFRRPAVAVASIGVEMRVNGEMSPIGHVYVAADEKGVARFPILNGLIVFSAVDKAGAPLEVPGAREPAASQDAFLRTVDAERLQVSVVAAPTASLGALPIGGVIALALKPASQAQAAAPAGPTP